MKKTLALILSAVLVLDMLATLCPAEISPLLLFDLADCWKADFTRLAEAMRACHQDMWDIHPQGSTPCTAGGLPEEQIGVLRRLAEEWNRGAVEFLTGQGMSGSGVQEPYGENGQGAWGQQRAAELHCL